MKATLADLTGWNEENRLRACSLLVTMLILCENYVVRFTSDIIDATLPFLLSSLRDYDSSPLAGAVQLLFVLLSADETVTFLEAYQKSHDLTSRQRAVFLLLIRSLIDARCAMGKMGACYSTMDYSLSLPVLARLVKTTLSSEDLVFSEDGEVCSAYAQMIDSLTTYLHVLLGDNVSEADRAALRDSEILPPLVLCTLAASCHLRNAVPSDESSSLRYVLSLSALPGVDALDNVFKGAVRLLRQDADPQSVPRRIDAVVRLVQALPAAGKPPSFDQQMHSLLTKLVKLSDIDRYPAPQRLAAAEAIEALVQVQIKEFPPERALILHYLDMLLPITTWKHGIRTPKCLEHGLNALSALLRALNKQDCRVHEASGVPPDQQAPSFLEEPFAGSLAGRAVGNFDSDSPGVRSAAITLADGLYRRLPDSSARELVYPLICRLDDSDGRVTCQALSLSRDIYRWLILRQDDAETRGNALLSDEAVGMISLHLDDPCKEIAASCVAFAEDILNEGPRPDVAVLESRCSEALGRCVRKDVYDSLASRARARLAVLPLHPSSEPCSSSVEPEDAPREVATPSSPIGPS